MISDTALSLYESLPIAQQQEESTTLVLHSFIQQVYTGQLVRFVIGLI